jgi:hypothetical protein
MNYQILDIVHRSRIMRQNGGSGAAGLDQNLLFFSCGPPYLSVMDQIAKHEGAPPEWIEAIDRAEADLAAGRTVPVDDALAELQKLEDEMRDGAILASKR